VRKCLHLRRWLRPSEDGANGTETCRGSNTVTTYVILRCTCWKIKVHHSEMHGVDSYKKLLCLWVALFCKIQLSPPATRFSSASCLQFCEQTVRGFFLFASNELGTLRRDLKHWDWLHVVQNCCYQLKYNLRYFFLSPRWPLICFNVTVCVTALSASKQRMMKFASLRPHCCNFLESLTR
jgi:hypothetical protein